ncbi:hypothetical protein K6U06_05720 [Acidiferrimicrobium sp. IK]|uniref:hypothetical protein n=1 Tax=Acidiferrimicrobium sp. IK TaxID=2871700 RepID=UPI0021CAE5A3|nr:hypothetical protein [Acidiferrimicrobium sp. IK]MCU4183850.1 hypothetical protein [Acidiferrimicrobium sp. IK]
MSALLRPVASVDDLVRLAPLDRFRALIDGENFAPRFRAEPLVFDIDDPIYGYGCGVEGCLGHVTRMAGWCTPHGLERRDVLRAGMGEAAWRAGALALPDRARPAPRARRPACRFCPDRDAGRDGLCLRHSTSRRRALGVAGDGWDESAWAARQDRLPGAGACAVEACAGRAELAPPLCPAHRIASRGDASAVLTGPNGSGGWRSCETACRRGR